jgi:hypothetical protein
VAYRGYSVILFAPVAALGAVLLTMPGAVLPAYSAVFMDSMATFLRNYSPVFMLGALTGHHGPDASPVLPRHFRDHLHQDHRRLLHDRRVLPHGHRLEICRPFSGMAGDDAHDRLLVALFTVGNAVRGRN